MKTSPAGIALIKEFEGCRLEAYQDVVGVWTIGYGDTMNVRPATRITQQQAEDRLANRLDNEFEPGVMAAIQGAPVSQPQFDAMISLAWNIGVGRPLDHPEGPSGFTGSSVARFHRACDYAAAADAFLMWNKAGGRVLEPLQRRRAEERALYLSEAAPASANPPNNIPENIPTPCPTNDADQAAVMNIQLGLRLAGDYDGAIDGVWGPESKAALIQFQARKA